MTSTWIQSSARPLRVLVIIAAALAPVIAGCSDGSAEPGAVKNASLKRREPARVRTSPAVQREMVRTLTTTTVVESEREIKLFPRAAGVVTEVRAEEGDRVEAGAVLAALDRRHTAAVIEEARVAVAESEDNVHKADILKSEAESRVAAMQLKWETARRDYERNEKAGLASQQQLDNLRLLRDTAENDHEWAKLAVEGAVIEAKAARTTQQKAGLALQRLELEDSYMQITAPFEGVIATRSVKVGDSVGPMAPAFVLTDVGHLRAVFHRPQRELPMFLRAMPDVAAIVAPGDGKGNAKPGNPLDIRATAEALPGAIFHGELQLLSPSIDPQSGSFRVTVRLGAPTQAAPGGPIVRLLPGMLVRLEIVTERHPAAIAVPKRALRREGEQNLVFVVDGAVVRRVEVDEGFSDDDAVEVTARNGKAIAPGAKIVVVGNRELEDGAEVVEEAAGALPEVKPEPKPDAAQPDEAKPASGKG